MQGHPDAAAVARSNAASFSAIAGASPGGRVARFGDSVAILTPAYPERPLLSGLFALGRDGFDEAYSWVEAGCAETGIEAFTVWLAAGDEARASEMERRGHRLDGNPPLMSALLDDIPSPRPLPLAEVKAPTAAMAAELNDAVYGYPGSFLRAVGDPQEFPFLLAVLADLGRPVACAAGLPVGEDFHLTMVATLPEHRRRGLAGGLVTLLAGWARESGCVTTSLVSSPAGEPMYEHLGYRGVGAVQMWERRLG